MTSDLKMNANPYTPFVKTVMVNGEPVATDTEGYILDLNQWSEEFARALAVQEGLELTDAHWQLIYFIREYNEEHGVQPEVRKMIKHFSQKWGPERGSNHALHDLFPRGGPQKQGNRLAGVRRTKGEH